MPGSIKTQIKSYLSLGKKEWNGLVVLLLLIAVTLIAPEVYVRLRKERTIDKKQLNEVLALLKQTEELRGGSSAPHLFKFNPSHLPDSCWTQLGLSNKQIAVIKNYERKGGRFRSKQDVRKMYALTPADYQRLAPYIALPDSTAAVAHQPLIVVDLNTADSAKLTQVKGIGPAYAMRIIHYRDRLGGFHDKAQLKEVFGIDEGIYNDIKTQFILRSHHIRRININTVELDGLKNQPYLNYKQANAIIQYRKQHGNYDSIAELRNIAILNEQILRKLAPYFVVK